VKRKTLPKTKISKKKQVVVDKPLTKAKPVTTEKQIEIVGPVQPSEREALIHQWKCAMGKGDLGLAETIRRKIKPIEPSSSE
jgi:hypothetical protein